MRGKKKKKMGIFEASLHMPEQLQRAIVLEAWNSPVDAPGD